MIEQMNELCDPGRYKNWGPLSVYKVVMMYVQSSPFVTPNAKFSHFSVVENNPGELVKMQIL